jgi:hypothetical protein
MADFLSSGQRFTAFDFFIFRSEQRLESGQEVKRWRRVMDLPGGW